MSEAKKQAIYIGVDDDITTIISNIKSSSADSIALVPPSRIGVLQSVVNLKLLARAAKERRKSLVLITGDSTLSTLAASADIPVAKNLSDKPKLGSTPKIESSDEVIEGEAAPQVIINKSNNKDKSDSAAVQAIIDDDKIGKGINKSALKANKKVPNFNKFRKWIILGSVALVGVVGLCIWLFVFAPHLTISISAKTSDEKIDQPIFVSLDSETNVSESRIKAVIPEPVKKTSEIEFVATGKKEIGEVATGKVNLSTNDVAICMKNVVTDSITIYLASDNSIRYNTTSTITWLPSGSMCVANDVSVKAAAIGDAYNVSAKAGVLGSPYNNINATITTSGGSKQTVTVVQQADIDAVTEVLRSDTENSNMKIDLESRFSDSVRAIPDSFQINIGAVHSTPAIDEATGEDGKAVVSAEVIYSMYGLENNDINAVLMSAAIKKLKGKDGQGVFDDGFSNVQILSYQNTDSGGSARLVTTAKIGPAINDQDLKKEVMGKKKNEIKEELERVSGIDNVEVNFFPFWLSSINDENRITIEKSGF